MSRILISRILSVKWNATFRLWKTFDAISLTSKTNNICIRMDWFEYGHFFQNHQSKDLVFVGTLVFSVVLDNCATRTLLSLKGRRCARNLSTRVDTGASMHLYIMTNSRAYGTCVGISNVNTKTNPEEIIAVVFCSTVRSKLALLLSLAFA